MEKYHEQLLMVQVEQELARARSLFKPIHSPHEGLGVVREEYIEFEKEVFAFNLAKGRDTRPAMRKELIQLATMALRTVLDALEFDPTAEANQTGFVTPDEKAIARIKDTMQHAEIGD